MKWLKKHKNEIKGGVQFFLLCYSMVIGFWDTYLSWLFYAGVPLEWYWIVAAMALAILSVFGLFQWIGKTL